ncbi:tigger transposable element-derived protein 2-like [Aphidius gifuensis]|uniref:tigger transposable element-derived protein 2-like n=1 Tax=Aphidius gifuensis TaxID=684658 RepID=UPI001CDBDFE2|nr:tigger transposable element-derived protein 2-like [Aphidius gifuensis]
MSLEPEKKKRKTVSIQEKLDALDEIEKKKKTSTEIARQLGVGHSTVCGWKKDEKLLNMQRELIHAVQANNMKRLRQVDNPLVDKATWQWFKEQKKSGAQLSGPIIKSQAIFFWQNLGLSKSFDASDGWLSKWKNRHHIKNIISCEDSDIVTEYHNKFDEIIKSRGLTPDQVFNADETGINFRQMPKKNLYTQDEVGATGAKGKNERITVMACSNASGTIKPPLIVIGKYAKPRAIKNLQHLPVSYKHQKSAWMSNDIFTNWFYYEFVPFISKELEKKNLPTKAILFTDDYGTNGQNLKSGDIEVIYLPQNMTSILQPMEQGCLQNLKTIYRKILLEFVVKELTANKCLAEILKSITIREAVFWLARSWNMVTTSTITTSWKSLWPEIQTIKSLSETEVPEVDFNNTTDIVKEFQLALKNDDENNVNEKAINTWLNCPTVQNLNECLSPHEIIENLKN